MKLTRIHSLPNGYGWHGTPDRPKKEVKDDINTLGSGLSVLCGQMESVLKEIGKGPVNHRQYRRRISDGPC